MILTIILVVSIILMIVFTVDKHPFAFFLAAMAFTISLVLVVIQQVSHKPAEKPSTIKATCVQIDTVYTITKENVDTTYFITYEKAK